MQIDPRRRALIIVLTLPVLVFFVAFDLVKLPFVLLFVPIWGFLDFIEVLKGEKSMFFSMIGEISIMGIIMWMELVGLDQPKWIS